MTITFEPEKAALYPFTSEVEMLLGGIGQLVHPDGHLQFGEQEEDDEIIAYSPKLPEAELEEFCRVNIDNYEAYYERYQDLLENSEPAPQIEAFWL